DFRDSGGAFFASTRRAYGQIAMAAAWNRSRGTRFQTLLKGSVRSSFTARGTRRMSHPADVRKTTPAVRIARAGAHGLPRCTPRAAEIVIAPRRTSNPRTTQ